MFLSLLPERNAFDDDTGGSLVPRSPPANFSRASGSKVVPAPWPPRHRVAQDERREAGLRMRSFYTAASSFSNALFSFTPVT